MVYLTRLRLLDFPRLCARLHPYRYGMEAPNELAEEILIKLPPWNGRFVSVPPIIRQAHWLILRSAGVAAAVKTSKIPITVKAAQSDITCKFLKISRSCLPEG